MTIEIYRQDDSLFNIQEYDRYGRKIEGGPVARRAEVEAGFNKADIGTAVGEASVFELSSDLQKPGDDEVRGFITGFFPQYTWEPLTDKKPEVTIGGVTFRLK